MPRYLTAHRERAKPRRFAGALVAGTAARSRPVSVKKAWRSSVGTSFGNPDRCSLSPSVSKRTGMSLPS
jgi:hypothetical protein